MTNTKRLAVEAERDEYKRIAERVTELRRSDRDSRAERRRNIYAWSVLIISAAIAVILSFNAFMGFAEWLIGG